MTPIEQNHKLSEALGEKKVDRKMYQQLVGRLIYLAHTRPDITYSVSVISQFMHDPRDSSIGNLLNPPLLKEHPGKGILFKKTSNIALEIYTNADFAESLLDRWSTTGYCTFLGGNLVSWRSKQNVVARSSAEAEFKAMAAGVCELLWVKIILEDLKVQWSKPMKLYCDNKSTISIAHNSVQHDRIKHIEIDRHFTKEKSDSGLICTPNVPTRHQLADVLTKGLCSNVFHKNISKLIMEYLYSPA